MLREHLFHKRAPADPLFRWRGGEVSRVEALSDGVFAVTLTLLIVSASVPETFYQLWLTIQALPVFLVCYLVLMMAWRYHYLFFRRYGLEDTLTTGLNAAFLFVILFYAYPLKFQATFLWKLILGQGVGEMFLAPEGSLWAANPLSQRIGMMAFFSLGVLGVFGLLFLLVLRAYWLRQELELDALESYLTRASLRSHGITVLVALLSLLLLAMTRNPGASGVVYFLLAPLHLFAGLWTRFHVRKLRDQLFLPGQESILPAMEVGPGISGQEESQS